MIAILDMRGVTLLASGDDLIIAPSGNTLLGAVVVAPRHSSAVASNPAASSAFTPATWGTIRLSGELPGPPCIEIEAIT